MGAGGVQFSLIVNGIAQGYGSVRETGKFDIKPNSEIKELEGRGKDTYGQVIETVAVPKSSEVTISLREADYENLQLSFMGSAGVGINQASATVTNEVVAMKIGKYTELANRNLASAGLNLTNEAGTVVYTLGTHYEVIYLTGQIRAIAGGPITEGQTCHLDYTAGAMTSKKIMGSTQASIRAKILFTGINMADDTNVLLTAWEGVFTPENAFDLLADNFGEVTLKGKLKIPVGKTSPYEVDFLDLA